MDWKDKARELRAQDRSLRQIARIVGKAPSAVGRAVEGIECNLYAWRDEARRLRATGMTMRAVAEAVGKSKSRVIVVCGDVPVPKKEKVVKVKPPRPKKEPKPKKMPPPKPERKPYQPPAWHAEARAMRASGASLKEIGEVFGMKMQSVASVCKGVRCPVNHNSLAQKIAQAKRWEGHVKAPRKRYRSQPKPKTPEQIAHEAKMRRIRELLARDSRSTRPRPVTLPKLSFLEGTP